jgi:hypothetical protein
MKTLIKTIFLTLLTFNVIGQTKTKIYNFSYDEKINDFHIKIVIYENEELSSYDNNSLILLQKENQTIPFHFSGNLLLDTKEYSTDKENILKTNTKISSPTKIGPSNSEGFYPEDLFFYDINFDGKKELFIRDETNYSIYNLETGKPFNIEARKPNGEFLTLGNSIYNYRGGFILDSTKKEFEFWGSGSAETGTSYKYKFIKGDYYLVESTVSEYIDIVDINGYTKTTTKIEFFIDE